MLYEVITGDHLQAGRAHQAYRRHDALVDVSDAREGAEEDEVEDQQRGEEDLGLQSQPEPEDEDGGQGQLGYAVKGGDDRFEEIGQPDDPAEEQPAGDSGDGAEEEPEEGRTPMLSTIRPRAASRP